MKLFNMSKEDDVLENVNIHCWTFTTNDGKIVSNAPKIERLMTPLAMQRKQAPISVKKNNSAKGMHEAPEYEKLIPVRLELHREHCAQSIAKTKSSQAFYDKSISKKWFEGYVYKIRGGCDKQVFSMTQGVLTPGHICLLRHKGTSFFCVYGGETGERRVKPVSVQKSVLVKGQNMTGPKRASNTEKLLNLSMEDDIWKYFNTYCQIFAAKAGKKGNNNPRNQRLVAPLILQRKGVQFGGKKKWIAEAKHEAAEFQKLLVTRLKEQQETLANKASSTDFYYKRISQVSEDALGEGLNGYGFKIMGGNDTREFQMNGILITERVHLLLHRGMEVRKASRIQRFVTLQTKRVKIADKKNEENKEQV